MDKNLFKPPKPPDPPSSQAGRVKSEPQVDTLQTIYSPKAPREMGVGKPGLLSMEVFFFGSECPKMLFFGLFLGFLS